MTEIIYEYGHEALPEPVVEPKECEECAAMRERIAELEDQVSDLESDRDDAISERDNYADMIDKIREIV